MGSAGIDASGNIKFIDVGVWFKSKIEEYLKSKKMEHTGTPPAPPLLNSLAPF